MLGLRSRVEMRPQACNPSPRARNTRHADATRTVSTRRTLRTHDVHYGAMKRALATKRSLSSRKRNALPRSQALKSPKHSVDTRTHALCLSKLAVYHSDGGLVDREARRVHPEAPAMHPEAHVVHPEAPWCTELSTAWCTRKHDACIGKHPRVLN